jgi:hypothetical protein
VNKFKLRKHNIDAISAYAIWGFDQFSFHNFHRLKTDFAHVVIQIKRKLWLFIGRLWRRWQATHRLFVTNSCGIEIAQRDHERQRYRLELKPGTSQPEEEETPVRIAGAVHVSKFTGDLDDEAFGLNFIGLSKDKPLNRGLYSDMVFTPEEPRSKRQSFPE